MTEPSEHLGSAVACPRCDAINLHGARSCAECGAGLADADAAADDPGARAKREASAALRQGYGWIAAVTWLFRLGAGAYGVVTLVAVLALASTDVPVGGGILVVALGAMLTALMLVGAIQILFQPFAWTVAVAALATVVSLAHLVGPNPLGLALLWSAGWAAAFWVAVVPMLRFRRLMAMHTDLYIAHHASHRTIRSLAGRSPAERHERLQRAMHRASRRAWRISAVAAALVLLASTVGAWTVLSRQRPELLSTALAEFEEAWNRSSLADVGRMFVPANRQEQSELLAGVLDGHGFTHVLPRVHDGHERLDHGRVWVDYDAGDLTVETRWALLGQRWRLVQVQLPRPPHEPTVRLVLDAWRRSDLEALASTFRADRRAEMLDAVRQAMQRRGWKRLPEILSSRTREDEEEGEVLLELAVARGEVTIALTFRSDGRWGVRSIRFPRP